MKATIYARIAIIWPIFSEANLVNNASCSKIQPLTDLEMKCQLRIRKKLLVQILSVADVFVYIFTDEVPLHSGKEVLNKGYEN